MERNIQYDQLAIAATQYTRERDYWLKKFSPVPEKKFFPYDYGETGGSPARTETVTCDVNGELYNQLTALSKFSDFTLHIILTAAVTVLLKKYTDADTMYNDTPVGDITVGTTVYRPEQQCRFVNTVLPLRHTLNPGMTFKELLLHSRETILEGVENQNYPIEILIEKLNIPFSPEDEFPLFDVAVLLENIHDKTYLQSLNVNMVFLFNHTAGNLATVVQYNPARYRKSTVERIITLFKRLLQSALTDVNGDVADLSILPEEERKQVLFDFNETASSYPRERTLHQLFEEQAAQTPDRIALIGDCGSLSGERVSLTYEELNEQAHRLSCLLRTRGVGPDTIVGIKTERTIEMIIGIFGILKAGGAYMPIDPEYPVERIRYMLEDSGASVLLYSPGTGSPAIAQELSHLDVIPLTLPLSPRKAPGKDTVLQPSPKSLAYVIYTSGSTGLPKGVLVEHGNAVAYIHTSTSLLSLTANDVRTQQSSFSFDQMVEELYPILFSGGKLVVLKKNQVFDIEELRTVLEKECVTVFSTTPGVLSALDKFPPPPTLRVAIVGGDRLKKEHLSNLVKSVPVYNFYGPTETTVCATHYLCRGDSEDPIPIGKPKANYQVYVLDSGGRPVPVGIPGELHISGDGVARGYLNRRELTSEKFIPNPFVRGTRMYRSGDLVKWLPDGSLEFIRRVDWQVKIRGFRIETGEIENRLLQHPGVKEAIVVSRETPGYDSYLCAYFVPGSGEQLVSALKKHLSTSLPDYMIPSYFVPMDKMPLSANGKINRKGLPEPKFTGSTAYVPPRNDLEEKLAAIWSDLLNMNDLTSSGIGIDDGFFEIGGHSLKASAMTARIHRELNVKIPLEEVFKTPTIRGIAQYIINSEESTLSSIQSVPQQEYYELSYAQRRLWLICQFGEESTAYNLPSAYVIDGVVDEPAFEQAVRTMAQRHEILRTVFVTVNGDPKQKVIDNFIFEPEKVDLRSLDEAAAEEKAEQLYVEFANRPFNLELGPLFRVKMIRLEEKKHLLIIVFHHIITDGWSQGVINNEIVALYNACSAHTELELSPVNLQYKDYAAWHNAVVKDGHFNTAGEYWLEKFKDKPNGIELPLDHPRKSMQTFNGGNVDFKLSKEVTEKLRKQCNEKDATLFMGILTLFDIFLSMYTGQDDIIVGSPIAGRLQPELEQMIGFLVNTLVYRCRVNPGESFSEILEKVKQETMEAYRYQDYPFDLLMEKLDLDRDLSRSPLFNVMLAHNNTETSDDTVVANLEAIAPYSNTEGFNMSVFDLVCFTGDIEDRVEGFFMYNSDLFDRSTIERMADNFMALMESAVSRPNDPVSRLNILHAAEYERVVHGFNAREVSFPSLSIQQLFEQQVEKNGAKKAVVYNTESITYNELNRKANQMAAYLREEFHVSPNDIVGVSIDRSIEMVVAILGIIKSGAGYVAVDPNYPEDRVLHMLEDSRADLLIIDQMRPRLFDNYKGTIINIVEDWDAVERKSGENTGVRNNPGDTIYVIYTSGSTGTPNGAILTHGIMTNLILWQQQETSIDASLRCLQFTSINFCVSFQEIMITLTSGGELHLIGDIERQDIDYLMDFLSTHQIDILYLPFSYLNFLFNESKRWNESFNHNLKHIITAGEQLKITSGLKQFLEKNPHVKLHNHYGSSEMHVVASYTLDASTAEKWPVPPAGKPIANTKIYILDEYKNPVPIGVWGELFVAGSWEVAGYVHNSELSAKKLVTLPTLTGDGKCLYRSGDVGRWLPDGNIQLKGRKDTQVKIRGFRVELSEVESKILAIDRVKDCVTVVKTDKGGQKYLLAYIVKTDIEIAEIKRIISRYLPQYMIPAFMVLERLPLMPNGKVDRDKLPEPTPVENALQKEGFVAPQGPVEETLADIWADLLSMEKERIGADDNFFELGGHSLKATIFTSRVHKELDVRVPLSEVFKSPTIRDLAGYIRDHAVDPYAAVEVIEERDYYPLSSAQKRMFILYQLKGQDTSDNTPGVVIVEGSVDKNHFDSVIKKLIQRHETLRTSFVFVQEEPVQRVHRDVAFEMEYEEFPAGKDIEGFIKDFIRPFDLSRAPLLRVKMLKLEEKKHLLLFDMHHIINDGSSMDVLITEFIYLYEGVDLPPLRIQYKDFTAWQNERLQSDSLKKQEEFWLEVLSGELPELHLPSDFPRPAVQSFAGDHIDFQFEPELTHKIEQTALHNGTTLYVVLLTIYNILLARYSGQEDIIVGAPIAGRMHADVQHLIGFIVNTLAMRNRPSGEKSFSQFLREVNKNALDAFENQEYQFDRLISILDLPEDTSRQKVFDTMLVVQNTEYIYSKEITHKEIQGVTFKPYDFSKKTCQFDILLHALKNRDRIDFRWEFSTSLFKKETVERMIRHFTNIAEEVTGNPQVKISEVAVFSGDEREMALAHMNEDIVNTAAVDVDFDL